jgi:hypothetical protein
MCCVAIVSASRALANAAAGSTIIRCWALVIVSSMLLEVGLPVAWPGAAPAEATAAQNTAERKPASHADGDLMFMVFALQQDAPGRPLLP